MNEKLVGWLARCPVGENVTMAPSTLAAIEETGRAIAIVDVKPLKTVADFQKLWDSQKNRTLGHKPIRVGLHVPPEEIWFCDGLTPKLVIQYKDNDGK